MNVPYNDALYGGRDGLGRTVHDRVQEWHLLCVVSDDLLWRRVRLPRRWNLDLNPPGRDNGMLWIDRSPVRT